MTEHADGLLAGIPAVTRNTYGEGTAWYLTTYPDPATLTSLITTVYTEAGVETVRMAPESVEAVRRRSPSADYLFLIDHSGLGAEVTVAEDAVELLTGRATPGSVTLAPGEIAVVREPRHG